MSKERGDGEGAGSEALSLLSSTLGYVSLIELVTLCDFVYYESIKCEMFVCLL